MNNRKVAVVMGSDSDFETMEATIDVLREFGIEFEVDVISAHRTPDRAHSFATEAEGNGIALIIAGAGGAAHLAGVLASLTPLPVIGVPMLTSSLGGVDSLYSTVQMPGGVPVASMGIGKAGAKNAGILAAQILALSDPALSEKVKEYKQKQAEQVAEKSAKVKETVAAGKE